MQGHDELQTIYLHYVFEAKSKDKDKPEISLGGRNLYKKKKKDQKPLLQYGSSG
jgi:hypothetical protein